MALEELRDVNALRVTLPWLTAEASETAALMGEDFWRYGVEENRKEIETLARYAHEQGLVSRRIAAEELFARPTLEISKI